MLDLGVLGPLQVLDDGEPVSLPRRKHRALLAVLALRAGEVVSSDRLVEELWGESPPPTAKGALRNYVSLLRKLLGAETVLTRDHGYVLAIAREQTDVGRFERLLADARGVDSPTERAEQLREALAQWRGPPLSDLVLEPFADLEISRLEDERLAARQDLIDADLALGRHSDLLVELDELIKANPYDERLRAQLMLALYRAGRQADALEAYQATRRLLADELGLEPGQPLRALEQAILRQDPALAPGTAFPVLVQPSRRTVTVVFVDLVESTKLVEKLDPEAVRDLLDRYFSAVKAAVTRHGGIVEKFIGDAAMAVFGVPHAHEDDALRAVRAAVELRRSLEELDERFVVRIGVNTGEVFAGGSSEPDVLVTGATVNLAKRLEQAAPPGRILLSASTLQLVRDAVRTSRATRRGVAAFRVETLIEDAPGLERRLDAPLVGRRSELAALREAFELARDESRCVVFTLLGEAGIGKTRLIRELVTDLGDSATALVGRCTPYGEGATFLPLAEMIGEDLAGFLDNAGSTGEVFMAVRSRFEERAADQPLLLLFDDLHWAEPTLLDLIDYLAEHATGAPMLVLCVARPEFQPERAGAPERPSALVLGPLDEEQATELLGPLAVGPIGKRIIQIAEGNPLYVEQLAAFVAEGGTQALDSVPASIEALLASRLDLLGPDERALLGRASVIGRLFSREAVAALGPADALSDLEELGLVHVRSGGGYRLHHALVRDVAYGGLPKALRAELHERYSDWLDGEPEGTDELVGYHLEHAVGYRRELGAAEPQIARLATDAGRRLGAAGVRAWKRTDATTAINLLSRATSLLPARDTMRLELLCELGGALRTAGELSRAREVLDEACSTAAEIADRRTELRAHLGLVDLNLLADPEGRTYELLDLAAAAIPVFETVRDSRSLGRAWFLVATVHGPHRCHWAEAETAAREALSQYRQAGWPTAACLGNLAAALYYGPRAAAPALGECRALAAEADAQGHATVLPFMAGLEAMLGEFEPARERLEQSRSIFYELGQETAAELSCGAVAGDIELLAGDLAAAERELRESRDALERSGNRAYLATRTAALADVMYRLERYEEAERLVAEARENAASDDLVTQWQLCGISGKLQARRGELGEGEKLAREAVTLLSDTDALNMRAMALLDLAEVLQLVGDRGEAADANDQALDLFETKGNVVAARQARPSLGGAGSPRR